jgi:hypothetical protein
MLPMTTFRLIFHTAAGLAEHGHRLPAAERLAWQALAVRLRELADDERGYHGPADSSAEYAEQVQALHDELGGMDTPAASLTARWVAHWLTEYDDPEAGRTELSSLALAVTRQMPGSRLAAAFAAGPWPRPPAQPSRHRSVTPLPQAGRVLRISGATLASATDHYGLVALSSAVELTCKADDRPWQWDQVDNGFEARIGPSPTLEDPSASDDLAEPLEHLAHGLNPGWWQVSSRAGTIG